MPTEKSHQQRHIDNILGVEEKPNDHSLAGQSWQRAKENNKPRTMSPDEWDLWYRTHPEADERSPADRSPAVTKPSLLSRIAGLFRRKQKPKPQTQENRNCARSVMEDSEF